MAISQILILDTETSGFDPAKDPLVEVACSRWSLKHGCVLDAWSTLVQGGKNGAEHVNGIRPESLADGMPFHNAMKVVMHKASMVDVVVAHNASFDRGFLPDLGKPWVCSMDDIEWPKAKEGGFSSVVYLALANGLAVMEAHRALTDVLLLARLFERMIEKDVDLQAMFARAMRPKAEFLSLAPFKENDKVKAHGFRWFAEEKQWRRRMFIEDVGALPFEVRQLEAR
jgi:DNA polymerase-3 subunit epsilon